MISSDLHIEGAERFPLSAALLIYGSDQSAFAMRHPVRVDNATGAASLGAGRLMTPAFLRSLTRRLNQQGNTLEFLRADVLVRQPGLTAWWTPPRRRVLRHEDGRGSFSQIDGFEVAVPALAWAITNERTLSVRALADAGRPDATTPTFVAPFWNTYDDSSICLGTMRHPANDALETLDAWVASFFNSAFTHSNANKKALTTHAEGYFGLWTAARADAPFDSAWLVPTKHTVAQWLESL
jgi:PRTRC genetic system protein B